MQVWDVSRGNFWLFLRHTVITQKQTFHCKGMQHGLYDQLATLLTVKLSIDRSLKLKKVFNWKNRLSHTFCVFLWYRIASPVNIETQTTIIVVGNFYFSFIFLSVVFYLSRKLLYLWNEYQEDNWKKLIVY